MDQLLVKLDNRKKRAVQTEQTEHSTIAAKEMIMQILSETLSSEAGSPKVQEKPVIKSKSFRVRKTFKRSLETEPSPRVYN